jgi:intein/homing endonuclease
MSGGCLSPRTKIFTRGGYKNIEDITEDDYVYTKEGEFMKVLQTHNFEDKELLQIEFDDGYKVTCTPEHKFFIDDEWVEARDLVIDDQVSYI